jgi:hypothetical protein
MGRGPYNPLFSPRGRSVPTRALDGLTSKNPLGANTCSFPPHTPRPPLLAAT